MAWHGMAMMEGRKGKERERKGVGFDMMLMFMMMV